MFEWSSQKPPRSTLSIYLLGLTAVGVWSVRPMIDDGEHHFDVLASLSFFTSLSISRHVSSST